MEKVGGGGDSRSFYLPAPTLLAPRATIVSSSTAMVDLFSSNKYSRLQNKRFDRVTRLTRSRNRQGPVGCDGALLPSRGPPKDHGTAMGEVIRKTKDGRFLGWYVRWVDADGRRKQRLRHQPTAALARSCLSRSKRGSAAANPPRRATPPT